MKQTRAQKLEALRLKVAAMRAAHSSPFLDVVPPPPRRPQELFLQIGRKRYHVASIREAVAMHNQARDASGCGASEMPRVTIVSNTGSHLYGISYNGRVWDGDREMTDF